MMDLKNRPIEVISLLNPAYCSLILFEAVKNYMKKKPDGMPFSLAYVALPMVLNKKLFSSFPSNTNARLDIWIKDNPELKYIFMKSAVNISRYVNEAVLFSLDQNSIILSDNGNLLKGTLRKKNNYLNDELNECIDNAAFIGKWLSKINKESTIYTIMGIRP
ncbi:MAG: hypothetical protein HUJ22_02285 [Gracilimonas sp.]|uniref:three component ABC system middle component n=1 Tax=Gracilimonas sp. TaxID=1974203 RepID=UPI0019BD1D07|nr:three component ABC system middle component [Gracilimonas sp.]MBD3615373.1 hypothetical protein [Gracilimonas sp.]